MYTKYNLYFIARIISLMLFYFVLLENTQSQIDSTGIITDTTDTEYWRHVGFEARMNNDLDGSLAAYLKILQIDSADWDANLAVARLYFVKQNYETALKYFGNIYMGDSTDVEALWGIGRCYFRMGKFNDAIRFLNTASVYLKDYTPILLDLASAYTNDNQLREAIKIYKHIIDLDSLNIQAYWGIGKLNYWLGKPYTARKYYEKALMLDSENADIQAQHTNVMNELAWGVNYQFSFINESEPIALGSDTNAYNIHAYVQKLQISKRVNDLFLLQFGTLIDRSNREYAWQDATKRWYDFSYLRGMMLLHNNRITLYAGYSNSDSLFASYGLSWEASGKLKKIKLTNNINLGYEYYYYWNQVGHDFISDNVRVEYNKFVLEGFYRYANVRPMYLSDIDTIGRNPSQMYSLSIKYSFFQNPKLTVGIYHQYRDYQHISPFYWSPQQRMLNGFNAGMLWKTDKRFYFYCYGNIGRDSYDINFWEAAAEVGYSLKNYNFSVGAYRYYNSWYENFNTYLSVYRKFSVK